MLSQKGSEVSCQPMSSTKKRMMLGCFSFAGFPRHFPAIPIKGINAQENMVRVFMLCVIFICKFIYFLLKKLISADISSIFFIMNEAGF